MNVLHVTDRVRGKLRKQILLGSCKLIKGRFRAHSYSGLYVLGKVWVDLGKQVYMVLLGSFDLVIKRFTSRGELNRTHSISFRLVGWGGKQWYWKWLRIFLYF